MKLIEYKSKLYCIVASKDGKFSVIDTGVTL